MMRLSEVFEKAAYFLMIADEGEANLVMGSPVQDSLRQARADLPQPWSQLGQPKAGRQLPSRQGPDEQVHAVFDFQLLDGIEAGETAVEGRIERIAHSHTPQVPQRGLLGAEGSSAGAALGQAGQGGEFLVREDGLGDDGRLRQADLSADHDKAH